MSKTRDLEALVRSEFTAMPGMRINVAQLQRLCGLEAPVCHRILAELVGSRFLYVTASGLYARCTTESRRAS